MTMTERPSTAKPREIYVTLNTRVRLNRREMLEAGAAREGINIREAVEQAIDAKWGSGDEAASTDEGRIAS